MQHQEKVFRSRSEWMTLISECRASGKSDAEWCREHGLSVSSFYNACSRLRKEACEIPPRVPGNTISRIATQEVVRVELVDEKQESDSPLSSLPVAHEPATVISQELPHIDNHHTIEIELNGAHIRVTNDVSPALLSKAIITLRSAVC